MLEPRLALSGSATVGDERSVLAPLDAPLQAPAPGVLANDVDPEGDSLSAQLFSSTAHGTLSLSADGSFTYIPDAGFTGVDSFAYRVFDGTSNSELAAATLFVGLSDPPPAVDLDGNDSASTGLDFNTQFTEGDPPAAIAATAASLSSDAGTLISLQATIINRLDGSDERLAADTSGTQIKAVYDAGAGRLTLSGLDSVEHYLQVLKTITYQNDSQNPNTQTRQISVVVDGGAAQSEPAVAHVAVIAVNDPPTAVDDAWTTTAGAPSTPALWRVSQRRRSRRRSAHGGSCECSGARRLAPRRRWFFCLHARDGFFRNRHVRLPGQRRRRREAPATVTIRVTAAATSAPAATNDVYQTPSGVALNTTAPGVLANDSPGDGENLLALLVSQPLHGTLVLHADGSFDYVPDAGFSGMDGFSYQAIQGEQASDVASVTITVAAASSSALADGDRRCVPDRLDESVGAIQR